MALDTKTAAHVPSAVTTPGLVSVVLPTYMGARRIATAIASVQAQTYGDWELIVAIDASPDDTATVIASMDDPRIRCVTLAANAGPFAAMNAAIAEAHGEFVAIIDDDDQWVPDKLRVQVAYLTGNPGIAMVHTGALDRFDNGRELLRLPPRNANSLRRNLVSDCVCNTSVLVRREALDRIGLFDAGLRSYADWDIWVRLMRDAQVASIDAVTVITAQRSGSVMHGDVQGLARSRSLVLRRNWQMLRQEGLRRTALGHHDAYLAGLHLVAGQRRLARRRAKRSLRLQPSARAALVYGLTFMPRRLVAVAWQAMQRIRRVLRA
jgi:glycosyltransferase involved in cell wall biosynthesis